ncbi:MAG: response regulator, partial [Pseudomonas marincola]
GFMHQSNGSVQVYSEIGVGTTFKLYFKALGAQLTAPLIEVAPAPLEKVSGRRILVVEDQKEVREILVSVLEKEGYNVTSAKSGDEAKTLFDADSNFHLLLTDIVMPGDLQGPALSGVLRKQAPDLQVVFMSGYAREATLQGNELRSDDIRLTKPVMKKDLLAALEKSWSRKVNAEV